MSNYINVLRRLEREKRSPDAPPAAPVRPVETTPVQPAAPVATPVPPPPQDVPPPAPVARTVIPLPNVTPPSTATPAPVAAAPAVAPAPAPTPPGVTPSPAAPVVAPVPAAPVARYEAPAIAPVPPPAAPRIEPRRAGAFTGDPHPGIATLLDNIRMVAGQRAGRIVVLCGASAAEPVADLAAQLVAHAGQRGMRAIVGTLLRTATGSVLSPGQGTADEAAALRVDLDAGVAPDVLYAWGQRIAPGNDLVVLTGPPLAGSIDAALLACASDGLVIVAESEVTDRTALHTAAERARIAGCRTLGVVMHGTKDRMPRWIRRIIGAPSETPVRED